MALAEPLLDLAAAPDGELARRYANAGDADEREAAFRGLVERHGAMVVAACRRVLSDPTEAEDAAQAVFLVLARKAAALVEHPTLGGWLHRVACHVAWRLRDAERARDRRERAVARPGAAADAGVARFELRDALDAALDRLPARYRAPLVLHYLEGVPQDEVASRLGLKAGTLASLLSRGRELLRRRLVRQGLAAGAACALGSFTGAPAAEAAFVATVTRTAKLSGLAGHHAVVGAKVVALSSGTLRAMSMLKLKFAAAAVAAALLVCTGVGIGFVAAAGEAPPPPADAPAAAAKPEDAVLAPVKALRANDGNALLKCWPEKQQAKVAEDWAKQAQPADPAAGGNGNGNGRGGAAMRDRMIDQVLTTALADGGAEQVAGFIQPFAGQYLGQQDPDGVIGMVARGLLADGLETDQVKALKLLRAALTQWKDEAGLDDPEKLKLACVHLVGAVKALEVKTAADLKALDLTTALTRSGGGIAELKQALAAFDLQVDAFLDSVQVTKVEGEGENRTLTVAYTAFDQPLTMPVKAVLKDGRWFIADDSPLAKWLQPPRGGAMGGPGGPGARGRARGQAGRPAQPGGGEPPAKPPGAGDF